MDRVTRHMIWSDVRWLMNRSIVCTKRKKREEKKERNQYFVSRLNVPLQWEAYKFHCETHAAVEDSRPCCTSNWIPCTVFLSTIVAGVS